MRERKRKSIKKKKIKSLSSPFEYSSGAKIEVFLSEFFCHVDISQILGLQVFNWLVCGGIKILWENCST